MKTNNNISTVVDQQTITSMEIAELTGKNHYDVLKAIRKMEPAWKKVQGGNFSVLQRVTQLGNGGTKINPYYSLTKTECLFVATKFNDEARAKLVLRWEQLEKERLMQTNLHPTLNNENQTQNGEDSTANVPADPSQLSRKQILLMALKAEEENERLRIEKQELEDEKALMHDNIRGLEADNYGLMIDIGQKDEQIRQLTEKTAYLNVIMADSGTVTVSQIAQDYGQSAVSFNKLLNGLRIQRRIGEQWVLYADFLNCGYVATRMIPIHHAGKPDTLKPMTAWTQAGRRFLYERLKKHGVLPLCERNTHTDVSLSATSPRS